VTAYFVAIIIVTFGFMALAIDVGFLLHARRIAQNAADPAALAGAAALPGCPLQGTGDPEALATDYALRNLQGKAFVVEDKPPYVQVRTFAVSESVSYPSVYAQVQREQGYLFARFLGLVSSIVPAEAEAVCGPAKEGGICPFFVAAPDPGAGPTYDDDDNLLSAFGIEVGRVYAMKRDAREGEQGNFGILDILNYQGGGDLYRDFIGSGCEDPGREGEEEPIVVSEDDEVDTLPGNKSGPSFQALETLFAPELTLNGYFPSGHMDCNITFRLEASGSFGTVLDSNGAEVPASEVADVVDAMTDPAYMSGGQSPCGGVTASGEQIDALLHPSVQGRFMQIVLTASPGQGSETLTVLGILRMYIACWSNQDEVPPGEICAENEPNGQIALYGVFADFTAPNLLQTSGLGENPLAPKHVVLVK